MNQSSPTPLKLNGGITKKKSTQPSRKGKKNWRKNVDISEIEKSLDELRTEDITGGRVHEQVDEVLFKIDKTGDVKIKKSMKSRRLKIDEILTPQSNIQGVHSRKTTSSTTKIPSNSVTKPREVSKNQLKILTKKAAEELVRNNGVVDLDEVERKKKAEQRKKFKEYKKRKPGNATEDLWDEEKPKNPEPVDEYLEPSMPKKAKKPLVKNHKVVIPAIEIGHPGTSYNPTFQHHQGALRLAVDEEISRLQKTEEILNKLKYPKALDDLDEDDEIDGDVDDQIEISNDQAEDLSLSLSINKPVSSEDRKTRAQRNKEAKQKKQREDEIRLKEMKLRKKELNRLGELKKEIEKNVKNQKLNQLENQEELLPSPKRLGPHLFKKPLMTIQLTEELSDSLRKLKPEGNVIKERFASLQARAIIEPRIPQNANAES
ncbi:hypothetical protein HK096_003387 [Nowakowskiella sp. JEL0078]|nr:hypothetical protein HK096_003387 [Nowakowskiella sp. JEL0078]